MLTMLRRKLLKFLEAQIVELAYYLIEIGQKDFRPTFVSGKELLVNIGLKPFDVTPFGIRQLVAERP